MILENTYCVYRHTDPSGKVYIGMTMFGNNPKIRWHHGSGYIGHPDFYAAIKQYGWDNMTHEIVASGLSREEAEAKEKELIAFHDSANPAHGYNGTSGGLSNFVPSPHVVARQVASRAGYHLPQESIEKIRQWHIGRTLSEETKEKIRQHRLGSKSSDETRRKISEANRGRFVSLEARSRIKEGRSDFSISDEGRAKLADAAKTNRNRKRRVICVETGEIFESARAASLSLGLSKTAVTSAIYQGQNRTCGGYHWKYLDKGVEDVVPCPKDLLRVSVPMTKELKEALYKIAEAQHRSLGSLIISILQDYISSL